MIHNEGSRKDMQIMRASRITHNEGPMANAA